MISSVSGDVHFEDRPILFQFCEGSCLNALPIYSESVKFVLFFLFFLKIISFFHFFICIF